MLASLLMFLIVGFVTVIAISVAIAVIGGLLTLVGILLFKVAPLVLLGWLVVKLFQRASGSRGISAADRKWLDG
jgi:hypothetical protein